MASTESESSKKSEEIDFRSTIDLQNTLLQKISVEKDSLEEMIRQLKQDLDKKIEEKKTVKFLSWILIAAIIAILVGVNRSNEIQKQEIERLANENISCYKKVEKIPDLRAEIKRINAEKMDWCKLKPII